MASTDSTRLHPDRRLLNIEVHCHHYFCLLIQTLPEQHLARISFVLSFDRREVFFSEQSICSPPLEKHKTLMLEIPRPPAFWPDLQHHPRNTPANSQCKIEKNAMLELCMVFLWDIKSQAWRLRRHSTSRTPSPIRMREAVVCPVQDASYICELDNSRPTILSFNICYLYVYTIQYQYD